MWTQQRLVNSIMKFMEWLLSLSALQSWAEASETDQRETKSLGLSLPHSGSRTHRCHTSTWVIPGLWNPSAVKMLICFRWREGYMWVDLGSGFIEAVCKSWGHKTVKQKPGCGSSVFQCLHHSYADISWCLSAESSLPSWHQFGGGKTKRSWPVCDFFKHSEQQLVTCFFSLWAESSCFSSPFLLVSDTLSHCNPYANNHDYECSLDPHNSASWLDWVWQAKEGMDIMDSTNFNETNLSYGLTFWDSPCEWQCQQSPLPKLSGEGPCNDGGN